MVRVSSQNHGVPNRQLFARTAARLAVAAIAAVNRGVVLWIVGGGALSGFARFARCRQATAADRLRAGLDQLSDHFYGAGGSLAAGR